jgi:hypothetical protein
VERYSYVRTVITFPVGICDGRERVMRSLELVIRPSVGFAGFMDSGEKEIWTAKILLKPREE